MKARWLYIWMGFQGLFLILVPLLGIGTVMDRGPLNKRPSVCWIMQQNGPWGPHRGLSGIYFALRLSTLTTIFKDDHVQNGESATELSTVACLRQTQVIDKTNYFNYFPLFNLGSTNIFESQEIWCWFSGERCWWMITLHHFQPSPELIALLIPKMAQKKNTFTSLSGSVTKIVWWAIFSGCEEKFFYHFFDFFPAQNDLKCLTPQTIFWGFLMRKKLGLSIFFRAKTIPNGGLYGLFGCFWGSCRPYCPSGGRGPKSTF